MKLFVRALALFLFTSTGLCLPCRADSLKQTKIRRLIIESKDLSERERRQVVRQFEGCDYPGFGGNVSEDAVLEELGERIRQALRDLGYFNAVVDEPTASHDASDRGKKIVDVRVRVEAGVQYRLGEIQFTGAKAFPAERLRGIFEQHKDDVFNATKFGAGLGNLRTLYGTAGYAQMSFVPSPITDESRHLIDWTIDISEGWTYSFGRLILDGPEPHAGAGFALLDSWHALEGKQYNPLLLQQWLEANRANWQNGSGVADPSCSYPDGESRMVIVKLSFPEVP